MKFAAKELGLRSLPNIKFVGSSENRMDSFGHTKGNSITVRITDRHPIDIMRTIAHEFIHIKQNVTKKKIGNEDQANDLLETQVNEKYAPAVVRLVKVPLNQNQFDALVSFVYNLGEGALASSTLLKLLNQGDYDSVPAQMMRWTKANGVDLPGLVRRRKAEADLFSSQV